MAKDFFNPANYSDELKDDELAKVTGGSFESDLEEVRRQVFELLNHYFILPQETKNYINTTTDVEALFVLGFRTSFHAGGGASGAAYGFESACREYGIPYAGYIVK